MIVWNNISSDDFGIYVERVPVQTHPARKIEVVSIPGKNGDLLIPQNAWENYEQEYEIFAGENDSTAQAQFLKIADWLYAPAGYAVLEDSLYPNSFRMARFSGPFDVEFTLTRVGKTTITFDCKPQRFLNSGLVRTTLTASGSITNPTAYTAKPNIRVYGYGTLGVGSDTVVIASHPYSYIDLDCEAMDARFGATNCNSLVTLSGDAFPVLGPGTTAISISGSITSVQIQPRWWTV